MSDDVVPAAVAAGRRVATLLLLLSVTITLLALVLAVNWWVTA